VRKPSKPKTQPPVLDQQAIQVLEHLRRPKATHPKNQKKLVSYVVAFRGHKITEAQALKLVENLREAGYIAIGEKGAVTYHLDQKVEG
jgi:hypothetical protein